VQCGFLDFLVIKWRFGGFWGKKWGIKMGTFEKWGNATFL